MYLNSDTDRNWQMAIQISFGPYRAILGRFSNRSTYLPFIGWNFNTVVRSEATYSGTTPYRIMTLKQSKRNPTLIHRMKKNFYLTGGIKRDFLPTLSHLRVGTTKRKSEFSAFIGDSYCLGSFLFVLN